ncbi:hypothetical protein MTO96_018185 [Rhipicephalus appendiculatus]
MPAIAPRRSSFACSAGVYGAVERSLATDLQLTTAANCGECWSTAAAFYPRFCAFLAFGRPCIQTILAASFPYVLSRWFYPGQGVSSQLTRQLHLHKAGVGDMDV